MGGVHTNESKHGHDGHVRLFALKQLRPDDTMLTIEGDIYFKL